MLKKILIPLDGSTLAEKALPYAQALAQKFNAELILVRVLQPVLIMSDYGQTVYHEQQSPQEEAGANAYLADVKRKLAEQQIQAEGVVLPGQPVADAILELASRRGADLIVMSTHGRSGLSRWVYGSVANKVLSQAPCPVFLVRAKQSDIQAS